MADGGNSLSVRTDRPVELPPPPPPPPPREEPIDPSDRKFYLQSQSIAQTELEQAASDLQEAEERLASLEESGASGGEVAEQRQRALELREALGEAVETAVSLGMDLENDPARRPRAGAQATAELAADAPPAARPYILDAGQRAITARTAPPPYQQSLVCTSEGTIPLLTDAPLGDAPPPLTVDTDVAGAVRPLVEQAATRSGVEAETTLAAGNQILWSEQGEQNRQVAEALDANAEDARAVYGEDSAEYRLAQARADAAWARAGAAGRQAQKHDAELATRRLGPDGDSAIGAARSQIDEALAPLGLEWRPPAAEGTAGEAREHLATLEELASLANQAANGRSLASQELDAWTEIQQTLPTLQQRVATADLPAFTSPDSPPTFPLDGRFDRMAAEGDLGVAQAAGGRHLAQANLYTANADSAALMLQEQGAQLTLEQAEPGSQAHDRAQQDLEQARELRPSAERNREIALAQRNHAVAAEDLARLEVGRIDLTRRAAEAAWQRAPHLFADSYTDGHGDAHVRLEGNIAFEIRDGQLYQVNDYDNGSMDYQLTRANPEEISERFENERQISRDWASFYPRYQSAQTAALATGRDLGERQLERLDSEIGQLADDYRAALGNQQGGAGEEPLTPLPTGEAGGQPQGPLLPIASGAQADGTAAGELPLLLAGHSPAIERREDSEANEVRDALQAAREQRSQLASRVEYLDYLLSQPLEARENEEELQARFYGEDHGRLQPTFDAYADNELYTTPQRITIGSDLDGTVAAALGLGPGQQEAVAPIVEEIRAITGAIEGDSLELTVVPLVYLDAAVGRQDLALFAVEDQEGTRYLVDDSGSRYSSLEDYRHNNYLAESGTIFVPEGLEVARGADGHVAFEAHQARVRSLQERVVDPVMSGVAALSTFASFTPLAPVAAPVAIASGSYLGGRSVQKLVEMHEHGRPIASAEGLTEIAMAATSTLPVASGALRFGSLFRSGMTATAAARTGVGALRWNNASLGPITLRATPYASEAASLLARNSGVLATARGLDRTALGLGVPLVAKSGSDLALHWDEMSGLDRLNAGLGLASGVYGSGMGLHGLRTTARARGAAAARAGTRPEGEAAPDAGLPVLRAFDGDASGARAFEQIRQAEARRAMSHLDPRDLGDSLRQAGVSRRTARAFVRSVNPEVMLPRWQEAAPDIRIGAQVRLRWNSVPIEAQGTPARQEPAGSVARSEEGNPSTTDRLADQSIVGSPTVMAFGFGFGTKSNYGRIWQAAVESARGRDLGPLRMAVNQEGVASRRPDEYRNAATSDWGVSPLKNQFAAQLRAPALFDAAAQTVFADRPSTPFVVTPRSARSLGEAPGGGTVVELTYSLGLREGRFLSELPDGRREFFGAPADNRAGFVELAAPVTYTKLLQEVKGRVPAVLSQHIPFLRPSVERRHEAAFAATLPENAIVSRQFFDTNQAMLGKTRLRMQFVVASPEEAARLAAGRQVDLEAIRAAAAEGSIDPSRVVSYVPGLRSGLRLSAIPGKPAGEVITDLTGRTRTVWAPEQSVLDVLFNQQFQLRGRSLFSPDVLASRLPRWARLGLPQAGYLPRAGSIYENVFGPGGAFASATTRYTLSLSTPAVTFGVPGVRRLQLPFSLTFELRLQYKSDAPKTAPAVDGMSWARREISGAGGLPLEIAVPAWMESATHWPRQASHVLLPKGARASTERFLAELETAATPVQREAIAAFRRDTLPAIQDQTFLPQDRLQEIDAFLDGQARPASFLPPPEFSHLAGPRLSGPLEGWHASHGAEPSPATGNPMPRWNSGRAELASSRPDPAQPAATASPIRSDPPEGAPPESGPPGGSRLPRRLGGAGALTAGGLVLAQILQSDRAEPPRAEVGDTPEPDGPATPPDGPGRGPGHPSGDAPPERQPRRQLVVLADDGLNLRERPTADAPARTLLRHGTFVEASGERRQDATGREWLAVSALGLDGQRREGWVSADLVEPHPQGAMGPTGRINPELERGGYPSVVVAPGDTVGLIATSNGRDVEATVALNLDHLLDPATIFPGDRVYLPGTPPGPAPSRSAPS